MGLFQTVVDTTPETHLAPANSRVQLQVVGAKFGSTKGREADEDKGEKAKPQRPVLTLIMEVIGDPTIETIFHQLYFAVDGDSEFGAKRMQQDIKRTLSGLGYNEEEHGDIEISDWKPGMEAIDLPDTFKKLTGWAILGVRENLSGDAEENFIKKWDTEEK